MNLKVLRINIQRYIACLLFLFLGFTAQAQFVDSIQLELRFEPEVKLFLEKEKIKTPEKYSSTQQIQQSLQKVIRELQARAYLAASIDSVAQNKNQFLAYLKLGPQLKWAKLTIGNVEEGILDRVGFLEKLYEDKPFNYKEVVLLQEAILKQMENNGYPFSSIKLDSLRINEQGEVNAQLNLNTYRPIYIEDIKITGTAKISEAYLENYLGILLGSFYDKSKILAIPSRLKNLPFLRSKRDPIVTFRGDGATINLYIDKKKASQFDFIVGVLPRNDENAESSLLLTGALTANAQNLLGAGEQIYVEFQQLSPGTQDLDLRLSYPFLFQLPFGVEAKLELYKRDSSYLNLEYDLGVQYLFEGGNYLKAFWNQRSTTLLNINEERILQQQRLPNDLDIAYNNFGLEYQLERLDYRFNPRRGTHYFLRGAAGFKNIRKNSTILGLSSPSFDTEALYDSLGTKTFQYKLDGKIAAYIPVSKRGVIKLGVNAGWIFSEASVYQNEAYRLGGNKLLRGFDEESVFASLYALATLEYRFIIGQNSYLYLFGDYGYLEQKTQDTNITDQPLGLGAGMTFETGVGVFGISYAIGKRLENPFDFRASKIHFGYVSYF